MPTPIAYTGSPTFATVTLSATPDTLTEITIPNDARIQVSFQATVTDAYLTVEGVDGEDVGDAASVTLPHEALLKLENRDRTSFFLGSTTANQEVTVVLEKVK
jgi:hypothetical protein